MQNLHHLGVELGIGSLQIVPNLVGTHLVGAENLGDRSSPQFPETRLARGLRMLADMLCQQPRGPEFLDMAQILWFLAGQSHHPSARFGGYRRRAATARQIGQGLPHPQIQSLAHAPFDSWPVRRQAAGDFRNRFSSVITQEHRSPLHARAGSLSTARARSAFPSPAGITSTALGD